MSDMYEVIDAFADGERVDPDRLERALADPSGRTYLVDLLVMRGLVLEQHSAHTQIRTVMPPTPPRRPAAGLFAIAASLLLLLVSGFGGFVAGHRVAARMTATPVPVAIERIVLPDTQISAPAPTRVIQVEPGVDWKRSAGGN